MFAIGWKGFIAPLYNILESPNKQYNTVIRSKVPNIFAFHATPHVVLFNKSVLF